MTETGSLRRRALLRLLAASTATGLLAGRAGAVDGAIGLQDLAGDLGPLPEAVIYVAREVVTMDPARPRAEAVAVIGDRIAAVGGRAELEALAGGQLYRVDETFADKVIVPGFVEQHVHPMLASLMVVANVIAIEDWDTTTGFAPMVRDEAGYRARLTEALATHRASGAGPDEVFLTWGYHHYFHGPMDRSLLDEIAPDLPLIVWHRSMHEVFLNSRVLERNGIDEAFLETFTPSQAAMSDLARGHFYEQGMLKALERLAPAMATPERMAEGLAFTVDYYHRNGITTACEPGGSFSKALQDAVNAVYAPDSTPFNHYFIGDGKTFAAAQPEDPAAMVAMAETFLGWGSGRARMLPAQIKLFTDGAIYSQLMQMRDGYTDGHEGAWIMDPDVFGYAFQGFWDAGWQIHVHNNGDLGMEVLLANLETAMRRRPRFDHRTVIVHFGFATPEQIARAGRLGAIVSANPYYVTALAGRYAEIGIGPERAARMVPLADAEGAGMSISFHSDMPMAPAKPLQLMWSAVNRLTAEGAVSGPDQRVGVEEAMRAMTIDAAYSIRLEDQVGSIEPGKYANFTILEASPFEVEPMALRDIGVWGTVLEGRVQPAPAAAGRDRAEGRAPQIERAAKPGPDGPDLVQGDGRARLRLGVARMANDLGLCGDPGALHAAFATAITAQL